MRKILVLKHLAQENLGSLKPVLSEHGFRLRFVNFDREPDAKPSLDKYQGLVVLGGWMGAYEGDRYPHLKVECELIERAMKKDIPVLGICLGAQILAHVLGAKVRKHTEKEIGWHKVRLTQKGSGDPLFSFFKPEETVFQMHGDTFDIPSTAEHLAESEICGAQAFRQGKNAYGLQFHLESDRAMIERFLHDPKSKKELVDFGGNLQQLAQETEQYLARSLQLSRSTFSTFLGLIPSGLRPTRSSHGKTLA